MLSVPVFFDTVFYLLVPLARAMRIRMGKNYLLFLMAISAGGAVTHSMVPPTPGPLAMAATLDIDLGTMILVGAIIALPMSLVGWAYGVLRDKQLHIPLRETPGLTLDELEDLAGQGEEKLPSFFMAMLPIVLPVLFIASNTAVGALGVEGGLQQFTAFIGNPNFALLISAARLSLPGGEPKRLFAGGVVETGRDGVRQRRPDHPDYRRRRIVRQDAGQGRRGQDDRRDVARVRRSGAAVELSAGHFAQGRAGAPARLR